MRNVTKCVAGLLLVAALTACSALVVRPTATALPTPSITILPQDSAEVPTAAPADTIPPAPTDTEVPAPTEAATIVPSASNTPAAVLNRITFDPGATTGDVQGQLQASESRSFVLRASQSQPMIVSLDSPNQDVYLAVQGQGDNQSFLTTDAHQTTWQRLLPYTQDYVLTATASVGATNFTLTVELPHRLTFAPGAISVSVNGAATAGPVTSYVLTARAGQTMMATITSPRNSVFLTIYGFSDGVPLVRSAMDAPSATVTLPGTQDYIVKAVQSAAKKMSATPA